MLTYTEASFLINWVYWQKDITNFSKNWYFWQNKKLDYFSSSMLSLFSRYYFGRYSSELAELVPRLYSWGSSTHYSDRFHDFSVAIPRCYKDVYVNSFFPHTTRLWNLLAIKCFPLTYDLSDFKSRINRHLLTVGSF